MSVKDPWILLLIPLVVVGILSLRTKFQNPTFRIPTLTLVSGLRKSWKVYANSKIIYLRLMALILFLIALSGPRIVSEQTEITTEGVDIILAIDASGSMAAEDFRMKGKRVNRLTIVKEVVQDFIENRRADRIGLVVFAGAAYTVCPLTTDYEWLIKNMERVELGLIQENGTAIGSAIASSLGRLQESQAKSKIVILLTDGVHNAGKIEPLQAAQAAEVLGIKIYTIGAGTKGLVPFPTTDFFGRQIYQKIRIDLDEETLKEIARITEGQYFWAKDAESLRSVYREIDRLEKTEMKETGYREYHQQFPYFMGAGLVFLLLELLLTNTFLLRIP